MPMMMKILMMALASVTTMRNSPILRRPGDQTKVTGQNMMYHQMTSEQTNFVQSSEKGDKRGREGSCIVNYDQLQ